MRRLGDWLRVVLLTLVLTGFAGFAWLSHHPETPWLERAQAWPVVGELAVRFRTAYLPPPTAPSRTASEGGTTIVYVEPELTEPIALVSVSKQWTEDEIQAAMGKKAAPTPSLDPDDAAESPSRADGAIP